MKKPNRRETDKLPWDKAVAVGFRADPDLFEVHYYFNILGDIFKVPAKWLPHGVYVELLNRDEKVPVYYGEEL